MGGKPRRVDPARIGRILKALARLYPEAVVELDFKNAYELTVATILAAQNTDANVNTITPALFELFPTPADLARAEPAQVEQMIFSTGFFRNKTKSIIGVARASVADFGGEIPRTMSEMISLPGVARKTANVVLGSAYRIPSGIVVDTHVKRLAGRLGLSVQSDPVKIERDLIANIDESDWIDFSHRLIWHGRRVCLAKKPACDRCDLAPDCPSFAPSLPPSPQKVEPL